MNAKKSYDAIIQHALQRGSQKSDEIELHHIVPLSIGGVDNKTNIVALTFREHYLCHMLLAKIYPNEPKLVKAFKFMQNVNKCTSSRGYAQERHNVHRKEDRNRAKRYMWRYLCEQKILNPTDQDLINGWKYRKAARESILNWTELFDSPEEWIEEMRFYIQDYPILENFSFKKNDTKEGLANQQKSRMVNSFQRYIETKAFWHYTHPNADGKFTIDSTFIKAANFYYAKGRCWKKMNWEHYFSEEEWVARVSERIKEMNCPYVTLIEE